MDDALPWVVLALALAFMLLALPAGVIVWIVRSAKQSKLVARVDRLEREVAALRERRSEVVEKPAPSAPTVRAEPERAAPVEPVFVAPRPSEAPLPAPVVQAPRQPPIVVPPTPVAAASTVRSAPAAPKQAQEPFQWERWIGVKGAALAAGVLLALGGLLFVQHAIRNGWIDARARCVIAALCGTAAVASSFPLRKRGYVVASDALTGAGVVVLFGAVWAAHVLYAFVPFWLALVAMIAVTVLCGALAARRRSQTIAVFGVLGGFATPLLLSLGASQPIGLFAYLLLLQGVVLALARSRRWPVLASLASLASPLVFLVWVATRYEEAQMPLALAFCGFSTLGFALGASGEQGLRARLAPIVGSLSPFFFAAYFAGSAQLQRHLVPVAILLAVLEAAAAWTAIKTRLPALIAAASVGSVATVLTWLLTTRIDLELAWECAAIVTGLAAVPHVAFELTRRRAPSEVSLADVCASAMLSFAALAIAAAALVHQPAPWSALAPAVAVSALCVRQAAIGGRRPVALVGSLAPVLAYFAWRYADFRGAHPIEPSHEAWLVVALAALAVVWALIARAELRSAAWRGAAAACILLLAERAIQPPAAAALVPHFATVSTLALLGLVAASASRAWSVYALVGVLAWLTHLRWSATPPDDPGTTLQLVFAFATALAFAAVPLVDRARLGALRPTWRAGALLAATWFLPLRLSLERRGAEHAGPTSLLLAALVAAVVALATWKERLRTDAERRRESSAIGYVWFASVAGILLSLALSTYLEKAELLIGGSLACVALACLSRSAWHSGLRSVSALATLFVLAHFAVQLVLVLAGVHQVERSGWPVVHWLSYEFGVPALALFATAYKLRVGPGDLERLTSTVPWQPPRPALSGWIALAAIFALFAWTNVEVINLCSTGSSYAFGFERHAGRDVWLSVAWSLYALALLVVGVRLDRSSLRWTSLAFFVATAGKVFLYDMGELRGLYRVASLIGLALALLAVSLLYQRFVFRAKPLAPGPGSDDSAGASRV